MPNHMLFKSWLQTLPTLEGNMITVNTCNVHICRSGDGSSEPVVAISQLGHYHIWGVNTTILTSGLMNFIITWKYSCCWKSSNIKQNLKYDSRHSGCLLSKKKEEINMSFHRCWIVLFATIGVSNLLDVWIISSGESISRRCAPGWRKGQSWAACSQGLVRSPKRRQPIPATLASTQPGGQQDRDWVDTTSTRGKSILYILQCRK